MNRKNLTAAVLAGLAGVAGIAGTAQAVNLNPDGLGQVLIYPYYTTNGGNQTIISVVNTTESAKAVKVRFLEGFNSREVLDFNLYLSQFDVWAAAIADDAGTPTLFIGDDSCTVPYLYGDFGGVQPFLNLAYNDHPGFFSSDGGPLGIERAAEGHLEMIEMGTVESGSPTELDITHRSHVDLDDDGDPIESTRYWGPGDCGNLVDNWTRDADFSPLGLWTCPLDNIDCGNSQIDITRNSGGLFGGGSVVNAENGTMYSYNAQALQGYDKTAGERHREPGTSLPSLNSGNQRVATVFFGVPSNRAVDLWYPRPVGAISAPFMHEQIMNEYTLEEALAASTEWVVTFPTKSFYVDDVLVGTLPASWVPDGSDPECNSWVPGEPAPFLGDPSEPSPNPLTVIGWEGCTYIDVGSGVSIGAIEPFTEPFDGSACEDASLKTWDRDERTFSETRSGTRPPVVSPSIPGDCDPAIQFCEETVFQLCYEVNVLRFGEGVIFGTPVVEGSSLLLSVENEFVNGWGRIDMGPAVDIHHQDFTGLLGLPVTGFAAYEFENNFVGDADVLAFYGGLFMHRANVRRTENHCEFDPDEDCRIGQEP